MEEDTLLPQPVASGSKPRQRHRKVSQAAAPAAPSAQEAEEIATAVPVLVNSDGYGSDAALPTLGESSKSANVTATKPKRRSKPRTGVEGDRQPLQAGSAPPPVSEKKKKRKAAKLLALQEGLATTAPADTPSKISARQHVKQGKTKAKKRKQPDQSEKWPAIPISRNEVSRIPPLWSQDGKFYFIVSGTSIFAHSSHAPDFPRLSTLNSTHPSGHQKPITSIVLSPTNPSQLITCSLDGLVKFWDWKDGSLSRTVNLGRSGEEAELYHLATGMVYDKSYVFATMSKLRDARKEARNLAGDSAVARHYRVVAVPVLAPDAAEPNRYILVGRLSNPPSALFVSPRQTYVVALAANKAYTFRLPSSPAPVDSDTSTWHTTLVKFVSDHPFTCGAFAPDQSVSSKSPQREEWFATGDRHGVIKLWHGLGAAFRQLRGPELTPGQAREGETRGIEKRLPTTQLHWHAHSVAGIAFTPSGAQLLSVGEESVLVQWHLASGKREYVPRLGGSPIVNLAVKAGMKGTEEEWWMGFSDGSTVRVGANSGTVSSVGQGIRVAQNRAADMPYPLVLHPPTSSLVIPSSHPSTLQFVDPLASIVLFDLEVAPSNRVARRDEEELQPVVVEKVVFSETADSKSKWMATMEGRRGDDSEGGRVKNLKIWEWDGSRYTINTQLPRPHGAEDVTSLIFSIPIASASVAGGAAMPYLLTTASDGSVKIWHVRAVKKAEEGKPSKKGPMYELYWTTRSSFTYRSMAVSDSAFSPDATIVALGHGSLISLWDVESNILLKTLDTGLVGSVKNLGFVGREGRYLVAAGDKGLATWDLLACEVMWSQTCPVNHLVTFRNSSDFAVTSLNTSGQLGSQLAIYTATSAEAIRHIAVEQTIAHICAVPSTASTSTSSHSKSSPAAPSRSLQFIISTPSYELFRIGDSTFQSKAAPAAKDVSKAVLPAQPASIWQEMFGADAFLDGSASAPLDDETKEARSALQARARASGRPSEVFDGPSHTLPPPSLLFDAFLEEMLAMKKDETRVEVVRADLGHQHGLVYDRLMEDDAIADVGADVGGGLRLSSGRVGDIGTSRTVKDDEIEELEMFFKELLAGSAAGSAPAAAPATAPASAIKSGHAGANGTPGKVNGTPGKVNGIPGKVNGSPGKLNSTPGKLNSTPGKVNGTPKAWANGDAGASGNGPIHGDGDRDEDDAEDNREVQPPSSDQGEPGSGSKKRGKKRRAPKGE